MFSHDLINNGVFVSVIVPCFNAADTIEHCLSSLLRQDYHNFEIIVVDDCSADNTLEIVKSFSSVKIVNSTQNMGASLARNAGVEVAKGDVLVFVDSDVVVADDSLRLLCEALRTHTKALVVQGDYSRRSSGLGFVSDYKNLDLVYRSSLNPAWSASFAAFFFAIRKKTYWSVGGFLPGINGAVAEDVDMGYRLGKGEKVCFMDRQIVVDHLKEYSLRGMIKGNYYKLAGLVNINVSSRGKYKAGENATLPYYLNIFLPMLIVLAAFSALLTPLGPSVVVLLLVGFLFNNRGFLLFLCGERSGLFAARCTAMLFVEYLFVFLSLASLMIGHLLRWKKSSR